MSRISRWQETVVFMLSFAQEEPCTLIEEIIKMTVHVVKDTQAVRLARFFFFLLAEVVSCFQ